ncbi:hypothetical protein RND81_09G257100 [Saponaria officinalis]|uniref:Uncharacterized protein n=1 Tax=Saponaria officinalis TaxID=3572 RepID=A0AAW1IS89_SAPOF
MENEDAQLVRKRKMDNDRGEDRGEAIEENGEEETEMNFYGSEEMKHGVAHILEKIEGFNQLVSEMLESGKAHFNKLNTDFEERILMIHKEQMEKWQDDIKELRMIDSTNEELNARLNNVKCLLQTVHTNL